MSSTNNSNDRCEIDPDHRLFQDFKHRRLHITTCLVWRPGAGGHFVHAALGSQTSKITAVNEYLTGDPVFANFEPHYVPVDAENLAWRFDPDQAYDAVLHDPLSATSDICTVPILASHLPPAVLLRIYSCTVDEMIVIDIAAEDLWIPRLLWFHKVLLNHDYGRKPHLLADLVTEVECAPVQWQWQEALCNRLARHGISLPLDNTILVWKYLAHCFNRGLDHMDPDRFVEFSHHTISQKLKIGTYWEQRLLASTYYDQSVSHCKAGVARYTRLDFAQLFFDGRLPKDSAITGIDKRLLRSYSGDNARLLGDIKQIMIPNDPMTSWLDTSISKLHSRLGAWSS